MTEKFVYIARYQKCGCVFGIQSDFFDKDTALGVFDFLKTGKTYIERVSFEDYREKICKEPTFLSCNCCQFQKEIF